MKEVLKGLKRGLVVCAILFAGILVAAMNSQTLIIVEAWEESTM